MELRVVFIYKGRKRKLFIVTPEEELALRTRLESHPKSVFVAWGSWVGDARMERRIGRWIPYVDNFVVTSDYPDSNCLCGIVSQAHVAGVRVRDLDSFWLETSHTVPARPGSLIRHLAKHAVHRDRSQRLYAVFKQGVEPLLALAMLILLSPILFLTALLVKMTSQGPVIYSQVRLGYRGRNFKIYKFRSMQLDAEKDGPRWASTSEADPSLTPIGRFLRASHLDELPQLWNIVCGELSFIGPRPERPEFVHQLTQHFPLFRLRPLMRPGITGWAQVEQGYANTVVDSLRKLEFDLFYMIKQSPRLDALILFRTVAVIFTGGTEKMKRMRVEENAAIR